MYDVGPYYLPKIIVEIPITSILPMIFALIVYFKMGLTITVSQFFYFYLITLLLAHSSTSIGYAISTLFNKEEDALSMTGLIMLPFVMFGGQFANSGNI